MHLSRTSRSLHSPLPLDSPLDLYLSTLLSLPLLSPLYLSTLRGPSPCHAHMPCDLSWEHACMHVISMRSLAMPCAPQASPRPPLHASPPSPHLLRLTSFARDSAGAVGHSPLAWQTPIGTREIAWRSHACMHACMHSPLAWQTPTGGMATCHWERAIGSVPLGACHWERSIGSVALGACRWPTCQWPTCRWPTCRWPTCRLSRP